MKIHLCDAAWKLYDRKQWKKLDRHREECNSCFREDKMMTDEQKRHARELRYRRLFGITIEEYDAILTFQGGGCAICGKPHEKYNFPVDHDHKSGLTRGVLCTVCNQLLKERVDRTWLENALKYFISPPSFMALGRLPQGRVGRVTKKSKRRKHGKAAM